MTLQPAPLHLNDHKLPQNQGAYFTRTSDGLKIRFAFWMGHNVSNGTVLLFPGRTEYIERCGRTIEQFTEAGYSVVAIDWRGQGLSDRVAKENRFVGHIDDYDAYQIDVAAVVDAARELALPKPFFLLGHSMGGAIGLRALGNGLEVAAAAFTSPMWDIHLSPVQRRLAGPLSWAATAVGKGESFAPGNTGQHDTPYVLSVAFDANRLTRSPERFQYMVDQARELPDMQTGAPSFGWLFATLKEAQSLSQMTSPNIPCVTLYGSDEVLVDVPTIERRMASWPNGKIHGFNGAKHEPLSEISDVRDKAFSMIFELFRSASL